jgi:hypothetical protein
MDTLRPALCASTSNSRKKIRAERLTVAGLISVGKMEIRPTGHLLLRTGTLVGFVVYRYTICVVVFERASRQP